MDMVTLDKVRNVFGHRSWPSSSCTQSANCHCRFSYFLPTYATLWPMVLVYNLSMDLYTAHSDFSYPPMLHYDLLTFMPGNVADTRSMQNAKYRVNNVCNYTNESWNLSQDYKLKNYGPQKNWYFKLGGVVCPLKINDLELNITLIFITRTVDRLGNWQEVFAYWE